MHGLTVDVHGQIRIHTQDWFGIDIMDKLMCSALPGAPVESFIGELSRHDTWYVGETI